MIELTKLNGVGICVNCELIETITENPDTTIFLTSGNLYIVKETMREVVQKVIAYKNQILRGSIINATIGDAKNN